MTSKASIHALALVLCLLSNLSARDFNPVLLATIPPPTGGTTTDVAISGNFLGATEGARGLQLYDLPPTPSLMPRGSIDTPGFAHSIVISNNLALIADGAGGLQIIDIADPSLPKSIGEYDTPGDCRGLAVVGTRAYLADGPSGLHIIDFANPAVPIRLGGYNTFGTALSVAVSGNYAYVADGTNGLQVIDVSNPATARRVAGYDRINASHVTIDGTLAYVSPPGPLITFDISNPLDPQPISSYPVPGAATSLTISEGLGYLACTNGGFRILDLSNPFEPDELGVDNSPTSALRIAISGDYAYIADQTNGLRIVAAKNPAVMDRLGRLMVPGKITDIAASGQYVYVLSDKAGLQIIDARRPNDMRAVGAYTNFANFFRPSHIVVHRNGAFVSSTETGGGLEVIDVSDPTSPFQSAASSIRPPDVAALNAHLYALSGGGIQVFDISSLSLLRSLGSFQFTNRNEQLSPRILAVHGTRGFFAGHGSVSLQSIVASFDISDPGRPFLSAATYTFNENHYAIEMRNEKAIILSHSEGTLLLGLFDEGAGRISSLPISGPPGVVDRLTVVGDFVCVAARRSGVQVASITDTSLAYAGAVGLADATCISASTNYVFVGAGTNGLYCLTQPKTSIQLSATVSTNKKPIIKIFGPLGTTGRIQRGANVNAIQDWQTIRIDSLQQIVPSTDSIDSQAFYRFVSP